MINSFSYEYDQYIKIANKRITKAMSICHKPEFSNTFKFFQLDNVKLWYFKFILFELTEFICY